MASTFAEFFGGVPIASLPSQSDVRDGVTYGDGREGTLIVTGGSGGGAGLPDNLEDLLNEVKLLAERSKVFAEIAASNSIRKR